MSEHIRPNLFLSPGTVNSMVDQLSAFASEVTRVALEVGTQGILGGQAKVEGVQGTWADLTRNVNVNSFPRPSFLNLSNVSLLQKMASNLTDQVRSISEVTKAVALGDLGKLVNVDVQGEMLDLKMTVNSMVAQLSTLANEVTRVSPDVGTEGILGGQAFVPDVQGMWSLKSLISSLATPSAYDKSSPTWSATRSSSHHPRLLARVMSLSAVAFWDWMNRM